MQDLILLHGAIGAADQFQHLRDALQHHFTVHTINFRGHGGAGLPFEFSIESFAADVLDYMSANHIETADIFGYSMGGYVALYLAKHHPVEIGSVFTFATKFLWTPEIAQSETKMLNASKIEEKIPMFAQQLQRRHGAQNWKAVLEKTADMMIQLGNKNPLQKQDYASIMHRTLIGIGDKDTMVTLQETEATFRLICNANLIVFPNTSHPFEKIEIERLKREIILFFTNL